ncbi:hypothetical protein BC941DRAFT_254416 [Chlamydoabsidia padenii]|nr:hypothetical protein BC941DRAFT_254416 [Chlamydoabsidia padenii]
MSVVLRSCIGDAGSYTPIASELTFYRKMAQILDIILEDTHLDLKDGEIMSKASKEICKANTKTFGAGFMMTGRRIDMIIESKDLELSTNEWKKDKVMNLSSKQQAKNIRTNKALLTKWLTYPIANDMIPRLSTLAMDWIGSTGYMFSVSQYEDAFVARFFSNLELPVYVANLPEFIDTLDALYVWKNHHCAMKDILLPAISKKESHSVLANLVPAHDLPQSVCPEVSPNVLFTPSKRRRTSKGTSAGPCNPYDSQDDTDDEDENNL